MKHPLVLVGVVLLALLSLLYGTHALLIESGIIQPLPPGAGVGIVNTILNYGFIIAFVLIVLGFALVFFHVYRTTATPGEHEPNPKALRCAYALIDQQDISLAEKQEELKKWVQQYKDLEKRLAAYEEGDKLAQQAKLALRKGDLEQAGLLLDEILHRGEKTVDQLAGQHFDRAQVYQLQFQPLKALPYLEKAYRYRPENTEYAFAYALLLQKQNDFKAAARIYTEILTQLRELAQQNPAAYLPRVADTLNNLGNLYSNTQRLSEAEQAYQEALKLYRELAQQNPAAYLPYVATTLNNLGNLYSGTQRLSEAEQAYQEALKIRRELAQQNPAAYLPRVADTLNNLGILYKNTQRLSEAEQAYQEALKIRRELAEKNPAAYGPKLATVLNNLAIFYKDTHQPEKAEALEEALRKMTK